MIGGSSEIEDSGVHIVATDQEIKAGGPDNANGLDLSANEILVPLVGEKIELACGQIICKEAILLYGFSIFGWRGASGRRT